MNILVKTARVSGFRGLENLEVDLGLMTVLTGMNNSGKTSFLKALQLALGNRQFISPEDFFIQKNTTSPKITIDLLIIPINTDGTEVDEFSEEWEIILTTDRIRLDGVRSFVPLRTVCSLDPLSNTFKAQQYILSNWPEFTSEGRFWYEEPNGNKTNFHLEEIPFFYIDAQRDIMEDTKMRSSYLGKMLANIEYSEEDIGDIEEKIKTLNEKAVSSSSILLDIRDTLEGLDSAMGNAGDGIEITPFTKKIRDLNKGLTIYYGDESDSFSMEYHGMGTRSWSSLLTLKSFINQLSKHRLKQDLGFFPIVSIEEPESHLHPNAQKKLYSQLDEIVGQKIISTHSPYIAATAKLQQVRNFYKSKAVQCGQIKIQDLDDEGIRKIERQVIASRGEIFFSRMLVFFEGETEEQALPILAQKYFGYSPIELGIDFVGVGGSNSYEPFIRFAQNLSIPWLILSDAEEVTKSSVRRQLRKVGVASQESEFVIFLDDGNDFEKQLIADGFQEEIKSAILSLDKYKNDQHRQAQESKRLEEVSGFTDDDLYKLITNKKTMYAPAVSHKIVSSEKALPERLRHLFSKVNETLSADKATKNDD